MDDPIAALREALSAHPAVTGVGLVGSRTEGREHQLSDWDLAVETEDFSRIARDVPAIAAAVEPLAEQWDRYSDHACYMLMLRGPVKVDLIFDEPQEWAPAWEARPDTLAAIDCHFWDWILWLEQKRRGGHVDQWVESLGNMYELLLAPMGVEQRPKTIREAVESYVQARDRLERELGVDVDRTLEREVRPVFG